MLEQLMGGQGGALLLFHLDWKERSWRSIVMGLPAQPLLQPQHSLQILLKTSRLKGSSVILIQELRKGNN